MAAPSKIGTDVLIGTGLRSVKLGFTEINVYLLGLYIDPVSCQESLAQYEGSDHNSLLCQPTFYSDFSSGLFRKTFRISFCRTIGRDKLIKGFGDPLRSRCDAAHMADAEKMLSNIIPGSGVKEDDILYICCREDGKNVIVSFAEAATGKEKELLNIESGGQGGVWLAFQNIYFDEETLLPTIRHTATSDLPNVLMKQEEDEVNGSSSEEVLLPSEKEIEAAIELDLANAGNWQKAKTWSEYAGREASNGDSGYKFGDLTLGVATALRLRTPKLKSKGRSIDEKATDDATDAIRLRKELVELRNMTEIVQASRDESQAETIRVNALLADFRRSLPFKVVSCLVMSEIITLIITILTDSSPSKVSAGKILLCLLGGGIVWTMEKKEEDKVKLKKI